MYEYRSFRLIRTFKRKTGRSLSTSHHIPWAKLNSGVTQCSVHCLHVPSAYASFPSALPQTGALRAQDPDPWKGPPITVDVADLSEYVGQPPFSSDRIYERTPVGVVMGLAWTSMGGNALYIEAATVEKAEGKGSLKTTGAPPDVAEQ